MAEPPLPVGRQRKFASLKPVGVDARHDIVREYYAQYPDAAYFPNGFMCREDDPCTGIEIDGNVFHAWFCTWWKRPENQQRTPF